MEVSKTEYLLEKKKKKFNETYVTLTKYSIKKKNFYKLLKSWDVSH